jgi:hypothetical protein
MRFMIIRKADEETEAGTMPTQELAEAMMAYNEELARAGALLDGHGLHPTSNATRVSFRDGTPTVTDGPFAEARELIAGFTLIDVKSRDEALEWVRRWPEPNVDLELRQVYTIDELGDAFTDELKAQDRAMRDQVGAKL